MPLLRSCPDEKCLPLPRSTITRTSSSIAAFSHAASRSSSMSIVWALAFCGRFSVMTATLSVTSYRIWSSMTLLAGEAEDALGDDVAVDLGGAAGDRPGEGP